MNTVPSRRASGPADPISELRRRLAELGADVPASAPRGRGDRRPVRSAEGGSADPDFQGTRSSAPDPQRGRSAGATPRTRRARARRAGAEPDDSLPAGYADGREADPVAAGSQGGTVEQAKEACLRLLAVRARSRAELIGRLATKGYTAEIAEQAVDRLAGVGLVDDAAFAEQWVHARHTYSGKGRQALAQELRRKGVAQADAAPALAAISADDETARASDLVRRKLRTIPRDLDRDKTLRRLVGMLARRGYDQATAFTVVKAELARADSEDGDREDADLPDIDLD